MSDHGRLRIEIENFGPIASGSFELRPLTLFIGPNNTGKSYAATLAHSIVRTIRSGVFFSRVLEEEMALPRFRNWWTGCSLPNTSKRGCSVGYRTTSAARISAR
jgi:predicted ATPase